MSRITATGTTPRRSRRALWTAAAAVPLAGLIAVPFAGAATTPAADTAGISTQAMVDVNVPNAVHVVVDGNNVSVQVPKANVNVNVPIK